MISCLVVDSIWAQPVTGTPTFQLCAKLKILKDVFEKLNQVHYGNPASDVKEAEPVFENIQLAIQADPTMLLVFS